MVNLLLRIIALVNVNSAYLGSAKPFIQPQPGKQLSPKDPWKLAFIAEGYKAKGDDKYEAKAAENLQKGSHTSPRFHWRAGHFRNQPTKEGVKLIWIEPMKINEPETVKQTTP